MATANSTQKVCEFSREYEIGHLSDAAYAVSALGDLLRQSQENGGFDGMEDRHWVAIGIALQQLSQTIYRSPFFTSALDAEANSWSTNKEVANG